MRTCLKVEFSAEDQAQADRILNALLANKLVTGGQIIRAPARFLWKGEVVEMSYITVTSFTTEKQKEAVVKLVTELSAEEVPMITFTTTEGNDELIDWIGETVG